MKCTGCDFENRDGKRFCVQCGTPLALRCPGCSAEVEPDERFCGECGTALAGAPAVGAEPTTSSAPAAVRKTVTVLFADLSGSTGFGERNDAEISRQVLARYHALLQETVDAHGGTVTKFMGDGMMATWGIPEVTEDDARRAVAAGVALQDRFEEFADDVERRHGELLALRIGINTGEVVIGEGDADLIGDALNVAARLEHACRPGHVLVGEETWRLTRADVGYEALGEIAVAGRAQPVAVFEVTTAVEAEPEVAAPFVGRDREMHRLVGVFDEARQDATARLVTVLGSPGVGKTRLSRELCTHVAEHGDAASVELRCDRAGEATFAPVAQLIRDASGITDDLDVDAARAAIGTLLAEDEADHARVVDVLAGLVGVGPARSVEETFWGVRRLIEATAATRPLVIVIDDIQWAEPLLLDLIEHLAEWVADAAVLLVALARPELREVRPSLAEPGRPVAAVVVLDGLDASATEALAAGLLGTEHLPAGLVDRLPASTDGNPLFVRELVRMLVDDRVIRRRDDGEWELTIDADAVDVPPTIQSLLGARVERLPAIEREVIEYASVVGAEFSLGALRELAGERAPIASLLESMRRKELVEPTGTYWGDEPVHRFHHVLIRDAAYRRLLKTTRADLHERVALWTDRTAADLVGEHEAATAFHYEQAFRYRTELGGVDDDETVALGRRAAGLLATAAHRALGRDDLASAGALSARALALLPASDAAARADLLQTGCECLLASGNGAAAKPLVEELSASAGDDPRLAAWAECYAAQLVGLTDPEGLVAADARAQAAAATLTELDDGSGQAKAHQVRAGLLARLGRIGHAELELDLALDAARAADDRRRVTAVLGAAPDAALFGPSPVARAGGRCLDVVRLLRITTASPAVEAASNRCQAVLESLRGRFDVSRSMLASARAALEELGLRHGIAQTELYAGMVEMIAGDPHAAIPPLRAAYEGMGTLGVGADAGQAAALLALALLAEGEVDEAELMAAESEALAGQNLKTAIGWRGARAEVLAARGDVAAAVALAEEAVEIAAGTDLVIDHADACVALADLRARAGDATGAGAARADAKRLYEQKGATVPAERLDRTDVLEIPESEPAEAAVTNGTGTVLSAPSNAAAEQLRRAAELFAARRIDECGALCAEDFCIFDHRRVVGADLIGRAAVVANMEATAELGSGSARFESIAVRGSTLALGRNVMDFGDWGSSFLALGELGPDGLGARNAWFDEADLDAAIDELDAWYVAGEGAEHAQVVTTNAAFFRALNAFDFDTMRDLAGPGFVYVDQRPLGTPPLDVDAFIEWQEGYRSVENHAIVVDLQVRGRVNLVTAVNRAVDADGGEIIWPFLVVGVVDADGRAVRVEAFAPEDRDAALARFEELSRESGDRPRLEDTATRTPEVVNESSRAIDRLWTLAAEQRFDAVAAMLAPDIERVDHRAGVALAPITGVDGYLEVLRASFGRGEVERVSVTPLAVRGERLSLTQVGVDVLDFDLPLLSVTELDAAGRVASVALFDEDDLAAAVDELDDRYLAGEGAPDVRVLTVVRSAFRAIRGEDMEALARLVSPELVTVDHQRIGFGTRDRDSFLRAERSDLAVMRRDREVSQKGFVSGAAVLVVHESQRLDPYGGEVLYQSHVVARVDASDRIDRMEWFDVDDWDAALARFDELAAETAPGRRTLELENAATRIGRRVARLFSDQRVDELAALMHPDIVTESRRHVVGTPSDVEWDAVADALSRQFASATAEPVAVRGDRLAAIRVVLRDVVDNITTWIAVVDVDDDDRIMRMTNLDEEDEIAAIDLLDEWHIAGEGAADTVELSLSRDGMRLYHARDWEAMRAQTTDDFQLVDHRPLGWPLADADGWIRLMQERVAQVPDMHCAVRRMWWRNRVGLSLLEVMGTDPGGGRFSWPSLQISGPLSSDGLNPRIEYFPVDDVDAAFARFDELTGSTAAPSPSLHNSAMGYLEAAREFSSTPGRDVDDFAVRWLADDVVRVDRRTGVSAPEVVGRDAYADVFRAMREAFVTFTLEPVAIRGRRLALVATVGTSPDGFELPYLILAEVDDAGRATFLAHFDDDDRAAAMQELEDRYVAGEGAADAYVVRRIGDHRRAYGRRDWAAITDLCAPDLVAADHRQLAYPLSGRDSLLAMHQDAVDLVPDLSLEVRTVEISGDAHLSRTLGRGTSSDGSQVAWECWNASQWVAGRVATCELFDVTDEAGARARFEELAATDPRTPTIDNECVRVHRRHGWLLARAGDDVSLVAGYDLLAPDVAQIDRRHGVAAPDLVGRDARVENLAAVAATFGHFDVDPIAVRGERLALVRWTIIADGGFHVTGYDVNELDPDGRIARLVTFDESQLRDAVEELETRHRGLMGRPTLAESVYLRNALAVSRGEVEAMEHAPGYRFVDHSPVGMGGADSAGMVEMASAMLGQVPGVVMYPARLYTSEHVVLAYMPLHGATADGNEYTWEIVVVEVVDDAGRLLADHNFQIEQWDEALTLFDERSAGSDQVLDGAELAPPALGTAIAAFSAVRLAALDRGDREAVLATYTPDFVREDHRRGVNFGISNREETVDALLAGNDVGLGGRSFTTVEVVGDEHALVEFRMRHADGFELVYLLAMEADEDGRLRRAANFDLEDRERASALLHGWAAARGKASSTESER